MKGKYSIRIENKRLRYDLVIHRNITVIRGDSATGKTTLIGMLQSYERDGASSGISIVCEKQCLVIDGIRWKENIRSISDSIVFIDEHNRFIESEEFASEIRNTDNYYVLITRSSLSNLPYSVDEIYGIHTSGKYHDLKKTYNEMYRIYSDFSSRYDNVLRLISEDSNSGFEFFKGIVKNDVKCLSAGGKSNISRMLLNMPCDKKTAVIADGAAIGPEIEKIIELKKNGYELLLYLPESFEWIILRSGLIKDRYIDQVLSEPESYIDSREYFSWERFFSDLLIRVTDNSYYKYSKSALNKVYLQQKEKKAIVEVLPAQIKNMVKED